MRVNLGGYLPDVPTQVEIDQHEQVMRGLDEWTVVGPAVLIPARDHDNHDLHGVYEVWWPVIDKSEPSNDPGWIYVNDEGVILFIEVLPVVAQMERES